MKKLGTILLIAAVSVFIGSQSSLSQTEVGTPDDLYRDGKRSPVNKPVFIRKPATKYWVDEGDGIIEMEGKHFAILKDKNNNVICYNNITSGGIRCLKLSQIK